MDPLDEADYREAVRLAAAAVRRATTLVIAAGAGMSIESGLPYFGGPAGFWRAYPQYRWLGLQLQDVATAEAFQVDPAVGWGLFGHLLGLYRQAVPHAGHEVLRRWAAAVPGGSFVYTSNADGLFQKAGFDPMRIVESHGSASTLQCARPCSQRTWPAGDDLAVPVRLNSMLAVGDLPACPACGGPPRPNVSLIEDDAWVWGPTEAQFDRYPLWNPPPDAGAGVVVVEVGAGIGYRAVRSHAEHLLGAGATLIRITPRRPYGPPGTIPVKGTAVAALRAIDELVRDGVG